MIGISDSVCIFLKMCSSCRMMKYFMTIQSQTKEMQGQQVNYKPWSLLTDKDECRASRLVTRVMHHVVGCSGLWVYYKIVLTKKRGKKETCASKVIMRRQHTACKFTFCVPQKSVLCRTAGEKNDYVGIPRFDNHKDCEEALVPAVCIWAKIRSPSAQCEWKHYWAYLGKLSMLSLQDYVQFHLKALRGGVWELELSLSLPHPPTCT